MVSNTGAICISHAVSHLTISACLFLWAAQEASPNTDSICNSQRRLTRTLCYENAPFLFECLALCLDGQAAGVAPCEVFLRWSLLSFLIYLIYSQVLNILFLIWYILSCNIVIYAVQNVALDAPPMVRLCRNAWPLCMSGTTVFHFTESYSDIINLCLFLALHKSYIVWQNVTVCDVEVVHRPFVTIVL